jgi:hypothetical protein
MVTWRATLTTTSELTKEELCKAKLTETVENCMSDGMTADQIRIHVRAVLGTNVVLLVRLQAHLKCHGQAIIRDTEGAMQACECESCEMAREVIRGVF